MAWRVSNKSLTRWIALCAAAELLGIAAGAVWYGGVDRIFGAPEDPAARIPIWVLLAFAGLIEGAVLGALQAWGLKPLYPRLSIGAWINLTIALAIFGWGVGAAVPTFLAPALAGGSPADVVEPPLAFTLVFAAGFGLLVGALFGGAQWLALKPAADRAWLWIPANAGGWALALPIIYAAAATTPVNAPLAELLIRGLFAGAAAGLVIGGMTALAIRSMPARPAEGD